MNKVISPGESVPGKVGAVFDTRESAEAAIRALESTHIPAGQVTMVRPADPEPARKIEPESAGIARTLVSTHWRFGLIGGATGAVVAGIAIASGISIATASPPFLLFVATFLGAMFGLLFAGFVSLRPDHDRLSFRVRDAAEEGRWGVVVHTDDEEVRKRAKDVLAAQRGDPVATL